jgi:uncharacterized protein (UPF0335 family)
MSERLEEIKKELELDWSDISYVVNQDDVKWLINRVEELELEVNDWRAEVQKWQKFYKESEESHLETKELLKSIVKQNKRYRKAINNIIEKAMLFGTNEEVYDAIQDALKALEGDSD